jgi:hypothetical protein
MGLYLCVFDGDCEVDGVKVGSYADFGCFRACVTDLLEAGLAGSRFPTLVNHSDCDGTWSPDECADLARELSEISEGFKKSAPRVFNSSWQEQVANLVGLRPASLYESFIDVDGEPLIDRMTVSAESLAIASSRFSSNERRNSASTGVLDSQTCRRELHSSIEAAGGAAPARVAHLTAWPPPAASAATWRRGLWRDP